MISKTSALFTNKNNTISFDANITVHADFSIEIEIKHFVVLMMKLLPIEEAIQKSGTFTDSSNFSAHINANGHDIIVDGILIFGIPITTNEIVTLHARADRIIIGERNDAVSGIELKLNVSFSEISKALGRLGTSFTSKMFGNIEFLSSNNPDECNVKLHPEPNVHFPEWKLTEVIRFLTGIDILWTEVITKESKVKVKYRRPIYNENHITPMAIVDPESSLDLFEAVANRVCTNQTRTFLPEFDCLSNISQSQKHLLNYRLVLGASVEYLIKTLYSSLKYEAAYLDTLEASKNIVQQSELLDSIKNKLNSALDNYKKVPPKKVLARMKELDLITKDHISAYESIRNAGSHGDQLDVNNLNNTLIKTNTVLDLVYRLILNGINYSGLYYSPIHREERQFASKNLGLELQG